MMRVNLGILLLAMGCGKSDHDKFIDSLVEDAVKSLPEMKTEISSGALGHGVSGSCIRLSTGGDEIAKAGGHADLVAEIKQVCDHDLHVALMKRGVEEAEAARKTAPDSTLLRECYNGSLSMAVQRLDDAKRFDAPAEALLGRFKVVCPEQVDNLRVR